ncbi:MAG: DUF5671 domain-containing protein [Patescibacteria group bacterium]|nr:DUF5671 domain-containing protein [Patescibacteria group bacterium]
MLTALRDYIKTLAGQGRSKEEIQNVLLSAGWKEKEAESAIAEVSVEDIVRQFPPPPPPSLFQHNMVEIFINFLSFILLGIVAGGLGTLFFQVINRYFADQLAATSYSIGQVNIPAIHYAIASLFVGFPLYYWAEHFWFRGFAGNPEKIESRLSKWLTYIVLLAAAGTIIGDLITVIFNFLQGELSPRFYLKALTILVIAAFIFGFYFLERKKIQYKKPIPIAYLRAIGGAATVIVAVAIVLGFMAGGTPGNERLRQLDIATAQNLSQISNAVSSYAMSQGQLPADLTELKNNATYSYYFSNVSMDKLPDYPYRVIDSTHYELCGTFNLSTVNAQALPYNYDYSVWSSHPAGEVCKELAVTLYYNNGVKANPSSSAPVQ